MARAYHQKWWFAFFLGNILPLVPLNVIVLYIISEQILKPSQKQLTFSNFFGIIILLTAMNTVKTEVFQWAISQASGLLYII